jgi:acetyl-CoA carboxylase biotin carboxyl carrier protein
MSKSKKTVDQDLIRDLAALLKETELTEIEIEQDDLRIRVARTLNSSGRAVAETMAAAPADATSAAPSPTDPANNPGAVKSPMVGTAYLAPSPGAAAFAPVGTQVSEGQTVLIVEAMKTMNHIPAPRAGKVTSVLVDNGSPVEFGEPLMIIE